MQLILASQSPYRRAQLEAFGLKFQAEKPAVDESSLKLIGPKDLEELTRFLSEKKARSLEKKFPDALIIGSDQLASIENERLDKPGNFPNAKAQLQRLSGKEHHLITSLALVKKGKCLLFTDVTRIQMKMLSEAEIENYLKVDQPFDCAGSYKIEKAGMALVEKIDSKDPSAIQGLPMLSLTQGFQQLGVSIAELWRQQ